MQKNDESRIKLKERVYCKTIENQVLRKICKKDRSKKKISLKTSRFLSKLLQFCRRRREELNSSRTRRRQ